MDRKPKFEKQVLADGTEVVTLVGFEDEKVKKADKEDKKEEKKQEEKF